MKKKFSLVFFVFTTTFVFSQNNDQGPVIEKDIQVSSEQGLHSGPKKIVEMGYLLGVGDYDLDRVKFDIIIGYQLNPYFSLGVGAGGRFYTDAEKLLVPFFADFRIYPLKKNISPYLSLGIGYSFDVENDFEGVGLLLSPAIGANFKISNKTAVYVGIGYEMQNIKISYYDYLGRYDEKEESLGAVCFNLGVSF